jgi:hypothetical protein
VKLGREAAGQVEQQLPILRDDNITSYVERVGGRLADSIPAELRHPEFHYTFKVVNVREINAFALPGGPMYVNRGMIEAARNEGEVAGVVAHELSHVALRHGTAQATKATKYQIGTIVGAIAGAVVGGLAGKGIAEMIDPTVEEAYWRENYTSRPYVTSGATYDDYGPAYRMGWEARGRLQGGYDMAESELARGWDACKGTSRLTWDEAKFAARAAWDRAGRSLQR